MTRYLLDRWRFAVLGLLCCLSVSSVQAQAAPATDPSSLSQRLEPLFEILSARRSQFSVTVEGQLPIDGKVQSIQLRLTRHDDQSFDLEATHPEYAVSIRRRPDATAFALPKHGVVYIGSGTVDADDHLVPKAIVARLVGSGCSIAPYLAVLSSGDAKSTLSLLSNFVEIKRLDNAWTIGGDVRIDPMANDPNGLQVTSGDIQAAVRVGAPTAMLPIDAWPEMRVEAIDRKQLELHLARGARRAVEVLMPSAELTSPTEHPHRVEHGELRYVDGQRLVLLSGTPEQIGRAHGQLLREESQRCIDSVLYAFGTVQTVLTGRWFRDDLEKAYARLKPHIPADHLTETRALAQSLGQDPETLEALNVFPELFHCSGFAVFDSATTDGKLYHGRVLDYMTTIGLQDCATTFIVSVNGKIPFANVGYAAFTGSVSGMNDRAISLGEMGGRGEGQWDGVPMATLMRRALEECSTLPEVEQLWSESPRTCEYYYVFADGKTNEAVGVAATPESIQFIRPGEGHPLLGEGIPDALLLSAGGRLETLRSRVQQNHGQIDAEKAMWLMSRPVAMSSNLHNVLFVPANGLLYVANADHKHPAAERPYVRFDLKDLLKRAASDSKTVAER
ncbi:Acyl-coenzyme A:6-aminopenicillanic acid acyl-transferase [Rosistilla carotiformis]|uniref:Acyl-coenzyme A:6-aminopenicillanic acid acyl-transferase n=1 Tax=Rosistilla carotiformis TaxID=2528017 RepID=A0A518JUZ2_9BACT|nr:C45 family peptidase [Rosistilla carotiformis]QDV69365.1 Acyl-coenzyme A:6-aminopenicillanic acid acyl-transferase [Rosistilla carotiformis]